jgi:acyl-CoA thioester hydrolase
VSRHEIEYRRPLGFRHEPVRIEMWVSRIGGAGFDVAYIVTDPEGLGGDIYAVAETELALYDFATASPRRMRPDERASLEAVKGVPAPLRRRRR